jgi:hypothetical protein
MSEVKGEIVCGICPGEKIVLGQTADGPAEYPSVLRRVVGRASNGLLALDCGHHTHSIFASAQEWVELENGTRIDGGPLPIFEVLGKPKPQLFAESRA